jgi:hypothetical protein
VLLLALGCGAFPDAILRAARESAEATIEEQIDEIVTDLADELFNELDPSSPLAGESEDE